MKKLAGTPKQIAWAEKIRSQMIADLTNDSRLFWGGYLDGGTYLPKLLGRATVSDRLDEISKSIDNLDARREARKSEIYKMASEAIEIINSQESASWFIDHR